MEKLNEFFEVSTFIYQNKYYINSESDFFEKSLSLT